MEAPNHVDLRDVGEPERQIGRRIVEFGRIENAAVHRRHDVRAADDGDRRAHFVHQVGGESDRAVLELLKLRGIGDRLLEPAERLRRHRAGQPADDVDLENVVQQLVVELFAVAVVEPAEQVVRLPAERRRRAEQRKRLVLAVPVRAHAVTAVEHAAADGILHPEGAHHGAGRQHVEPQLPGSHLVDAPRVVLRVLVEDVLRRPGALEPPDDRRLRLGDHREAERRAGGSGARGGLQELAAGAGGCGGFGWPGQAICASCFLH